MSHWIITPVLLPAVAAALSIAIGGLRAQRLLSLAAVLGLIAIAAVLIAGSDVVSVYVLGGWEPPFGIVLVADRLSAAMAGLTALVALAALIHAVTAGQDGGTHFHPLFLFQLFGINGAFLTGDIFNLFVFFEVLLISSYGLILQGGGEARLRAGMGYVVTNLAGSALFLFGLGLVYATTGTLNMADLARRLAVLPEGEAALVRVAMVFLLIVFAIKAALVPFHFWLVPTYAAAGGAVAALFTLLTKVGAYAILRLGGQILSPAPAMEGVAVWLLPAAVATMVVGTAGILAARDLRRLAAFAVVGSMGTLAAGLAPMTPGAAGSALYYMLHSTLAAALLFTLADGIATARGGAELEARPAVGGAAGLLFLGAAVAMTGLPPLSGFIGKLMILSSAGEGAAMAVTWVAILLTSFLAIVGFARAGSTLFWAGPQTVRIPGRTLLAPMLLTGGILALTLAAGPVSRYLEATAMQLFGGTQP